MDMQYWSKNAAIGCLIAWGLMVTIYVVLGTVDHEVLPPPFNGLIMMTLSTATVASLTVWVGARILARLEDASRQRTAAVEALEVRDGRLYYELARLRGEVSKLRDAMEQTLDLGRPRLASVGSGVTPEVLDLTRRIHQRMIEAPGDDSA